MNGITVNALIIGQETVDENGQITTANLDDLKEYFQERVIRGPGAFIEIAYGFDEYADAMKRKLLREIASFAIGSVEN